MKVYRIKKRLLREADGKPVCFYCGAHLPTPRDCTIDHVLNVAAGGTDTPENLQLCCRFCNRRKADAPLELVAVIINEHYRGVAQPGHVRRWNEKWQRRIEHRQNRERRLSEPPDQKSGGRGSAIACGAAGET